MKFKTKILHYKKQQKLLMDYLQDPGEELSYKQKIKLSFEIYKLHCQIEDLAAITIENSVKEMHHRPVEIPSKLPRQRGKYKKQLHKIFEDGITH